MMSARGHSRWAMLVLPLALLTTPPTWSATRGSAAVDAARITAADTEPGNWMTTGRTYGEQRFSPLTDINASNIGELKLAWSFKLDVDRGVEATPIVVDGVMYTTGPYSFVYALDARSGKLLWKFDPKVLRDVARQGCCDVVNRGVAVWKGRVYVGAYDGRLIAINAKTGKQAWSVDTVLDHKRSYTITGAPRIIKGKVVIGNGGADLGVRGYVSAYEAATGKRAWRFFTVPGNPKKPAEGEAMKKALPTWTGDQWWNHGGGGGGTVWDSMAYDPELDLLYIGTGNGSMWNRKLRSPGGGDNLYLSSIVALKPDTGAYVWHYQTTPADTWDYTATQHIVLADLTIAGKPRKVLMQAPKNGFFYVIDRATGELLSAQKFLPSANWATHVDLKTGRPVENPEADWSKQPKLVVPGPLGAHNWQPMSFNPKTGLVYIPAQENAGFYAPDSKASWRQGLWNTGMQPLALPEKSAEMQGIAQSYKGRLIAWDPIAQKQVWSQDYVTLWNGGTLSTAGNLVFQGSADGRVLAYAADTGAKLWESPAQSGAMAGPITYTVDNEQYVSFMVGWGGVFPLTLGGLSLPAKVQSHAQVLTYKLGGTAKLPDYVPVAAALPPPPPVTADAATLAKGRTLYNDVCGTCHGISAVSGGVVPDLRYLTAEKHRIFSGVVAGAYAKQGMPAFVDVLKPEEVEAIHQYLIQRAQELAAEVALSSGKTSR